VKAPAVSASRREIVMVSSSLKHDPEKFQTFSDKDHAMYRTLERIPIGLASAYAVITRLDRVIQ
jgi:hypothetical protein